MLETTNFTTNSLQTNMALMWRFATSAIKTPKLHVSSNINKTINSKNNLIRKNL